MHHDWMLYWTAVASIVGTLTLVLTVYSWITARIRTSDWLIIKGMKADSDLRIQGLTDVHTDHAKRLDVIYTDIQAKLNKHDHELAMERIDKEIAEVRADARQGQTEIRQDIKDLRRDLMQALRDLNGPK